MGLKPGFSKFQVHPNIIRQLFFLAVLLFLGIMIAKELYFMVGSFFGAITLYVILMYPMKYLVIIYRWPAWVAAFSLMILSLVIMVIPLIYLTTVAVNKVKPVIENPALINDVFNKIHEYLYSNYNIDILNVDNVSKISEQVVPFAQKTLGGTFSALGNVFLMYLVLYFMLVQTRQVERWLRKNLPFKTANVKKIITDILGSKRDALYSEGYDYFEYIRAKTTKYPQEAIDAEGFNKVVVSFTVNIDGSVSDFVISIGCGNKALNNEALRVIRETAIMNTWYPAINEKGEKINSTITKQVVFLMQ